MRWMLRALAVLVVAFAFEIADGDQGRAVAQDLTIGLGANVSAIDPHFHNTSPNNGIAVQIFDRLVHQDEKQRLVPGLATEWRAIDDTTWEFKLRRGVKFHDGSDFDAQDVLASFRRAPSVPNSPSSFGTYTRPIEKVEAADPYTVRFTTKGTYPLLPNDVSAINIISDRHEKASTADFNAGTAAIGTGPFKYVSWVPGDRLVLARNDSYWGGPAHWRNVTMRLITNDASRVAALLAGDVQIIEIVPTSDVKRLAADPNVTLFRTVSNRILFLNLDQGRDTTPFATDKSGAPLAKNPLKDVRVRRAISKAINRQALVERMQEGQAIPAGGLIPDGFFGSNPALKPEGFDPDGARKLLAEAGYPNGFALTLHGPNDRYVNDEKVIQAIAQMLSRVGIDAKVETMPWSVYTPRASKPEFSVTLFGWGSATGEASSPLRALLATYDREKGMGASNRGRYSNPGFDAVLGKALSTVADPAREKFLRDAMALAVQDVGVVPLYFQVNVWGARKGLGYTPRADDQTWAINVRPVGGG